LRALVAAASIFVVVGCPEPSERPEVACANACAKQIVGCSERECARGCELVLDRLVEREQPTVIACMQESKQCGDGDWAACAARVGPHVDGGPDVPPPPPSEF